jgi:hypothetical protein
MPQIMPETSNKIHPLDKEPDVMVTPKGTEFKIGQDPNGLFKIEMFKAGGKLPAICEERYTSNVLAKKALSGYIVSKG